MLIQALTHNATYIIDPSVAYRDVLNANFAKLTTWLENNNLDQATSLIQAEIKGATKADVWASVYGQGGEVCVGLHTSLSDSLSPNGNPRKKKLVLHETEVLGVLHDENGSTYVRGLVKSKYMTPTEKDWSDTTTQIKNLIKTRLGFDEWVNIRVGTYSMVK